MRPLKLVFHPDETCFPTRCFRTRADRVYLPVDKTWYVAETYQFVYSENPAIGLCGAFPRSACLGYHYKDVERITYFYAENGTKLVRVALSAHNNEHSILSVSEDSNEQDPITAYVAKGSHAFYPTPGIHWRIMGFANDVCCSTEEKEEKMQIVTEADVEELREGAEPVEVPEFGFAVDPAILTVDRVLTGWQRFWLPFVKI
jgi:hypothetical protein